MSRWLIIGGGIHGTHVAARLVEQAGVDPEDLTLLDPAPRLLQSWLRCTERTGMRYLRSPAVHHLGTEPFELLHYGREQETAPCARPPFEEPYNRPAVSLFNAHADAVIARTGIGPRHHVGRAVRARLGCDEVRVELEDGDSLSADRVVLALGAGGQPRWPAWAQGLARSGADISHIFGSRAPSAGPSTKGEPSCLPIAVIGAGISGVQLATRLASQDIPVVLVSGHPLRTHQFDSDPGWLGPRYMAEFSAERAPDRRRAAIRSARFAGSVPPELADELRGNVSNGSIALHHGPVQAAHTATGGIHLATPGETIMVGRVVLATGFEAHRPGGSLVDELIQTHRLRCATCGYPVPGPDLRWHPRVFVTGPLAELELGPAARNIAGARRAAERMVSAVA